MAVSGNPLNTFVAPTEAGTEMVTFSLSTHKRRVCHSRERNLRKRRGFLLVFVRH